MTIIVFAAASLTDAVQEISREYESKNPGIEVKLNFAGSQRLRSQLELGAKADVFISANDLQMTLARDSELISGKVRPFATSSLAVIAAAGSGISSWMTLPILATGWLWHTKAFPQGSIPSNCWNGYPSRRSVWAMTSGSE